MKLLRKIFQYGTQISHIIAGLLFFAMMMLVSYSFIFSKGEDTIINVDDNAGEEVEWKINTEAVKLPVIIDGVANGTYVLQSTVPNYVGDDWGVMVHSLYCNVSAYVNDELIYSYADEPSLPFGQLTGNIKLIIPINSNMAGRKLAIHFRPYYTQSMDIQQPEFGSVAQLKASVLKENMAAIMLCIFMILIIITSLGLILYELRCRTLKDIRLIINFVVFVVLVLLWMMSDSNIGQFMTNDSGPVSLLSFLCLSSMCVPFAGFCGLILPKGKRIFKTYWSVGLVILAVNMICLMTGICDPITLLPVSHVLMIFCVVSGIVFSAKGWKIGTDEKIICVGLCAIAFGTLGGIAGFIATPSMGYSAMAFSFGFLIFFFLVLWLLFRRQVTFIQEAKFIETYNKLAYTDVMTNMPNRSAFESMFTSLSEANMSGKALALLIFDINNLKDINDTIGHQAGDKLVKTAAESIVRTFSQYGECYRLGGDEFAVAITNPKKPINTMLDEFDRTVEYFNKYHAYALSIAYGYSLQPWTVSPNFFRDIYREAQDSMFEMKTKMHRESSEEF